MISSEVKKSVALPSNSIDINPYLSEITELKPSGFCQKIYVIKNNVAVALAGNVGEMTAFLAELKMRCRYYDELSEQKVRSFFDDIDVKNKFPEIALLLMWTETSPDGTVRPTQVTYPRKIWLETQTDLLGEIMACGSGAISFSNVLVQAMNSEFSEDTKSLRRAITQNMMYVGMALAAERTTLYNVNELWGAGFEIILHGQHGFVKYDNHAFVLMEGQFDENGNLSKIIPKVVQHYKYYNDILLIRAIELLEPVETENEVDNIFTSDSNFEAFYFVPSLDTAAAFNLEDYPDNLSFNTNTLIFGYSIIFDDSTVRHPGLFYESNEILVNYVHRKGIMVCVPKEMTEKVRRGTVEQFEGWRQNKNTD